LKQALASGRPIIIVTLHFGPTSNILIWFRSSGYPAAMVALRGLTRLSAYRQHLKSLRDGLAGLEGVASLIEVGQVWEMREHLEKHRFLLVALEGSHGKYHRNASIENVELSLQTGALHMAAGANAIVLPCLVNSGRFFSSTIHFGSPVPCEMVSSKTLHQAACDHLMNEFMAVVSRCPEECSTEFLAFLHVLPRKGHRQAQLASQ
jgi:hypothetical protein